MPDHVIVYGQVVMMDGKLSLVPPLPEGLDDEGRTDCAVALFGSGLPPLGGYVAVDGYLSGRHLTVSEWSYESSTPPFWEAPQRPFHGVEPAVSHAALAAMPGHWEIISTGESKNPDGRWQANIHLVRATAEVTSWLAKQVPESVVVHAFIRDIGTERILTAGTVGVPPK